MASHERRRLQPWVRKELNQGGFVSWKLEDKNRPGLPDVLVRSPEGRVTWVELKWSQNKTTVRVELSPTQDRHMKEWEILWDASNSAAKVERFPPMCYVLVASPAFDKVYLIPYQALRTARESFAPSTLEQLPGVEWCACSRADLGPMLRRALA